MRKEHDKTSWESNLPPEASQRRETFARYGRAMYHAQCVERQIAILLATNCNPELQSKGVAPEDWDRYFDDAFKKTLGQLVNTIKKQVEVSASLGARLKNAVSHRNWLSHNYFWERAGPLLSWEGREKMIAELTHVGDELQMLDKELTAVSDKWLKANGISERDVERELEKYKRGKDG